jgi:hypothetical protein
MNERIKALAFEAGQGGHSWYNDPHCLQAFAELIVRECAAVAYSYDPLEPVPSAIARLIQEHFGVEE